ncbi:imm11 family protein [Thalassolituus oleivorans]|jgi:hypothetical protein|uniref:Immunity MXAN-0049 protein domain-containing protein n=1 Tax=Thalassolituus oleivorans MIL-1 TaxID=1298593 RepID=M5DTU2_9GAMM|nr:hypothetical protein [Thalassolituus oleivorans]CCU72633.1 hypothetical protein TOL_2229 [Thalassolituus oleivorans MIL-1]
MIYQLDPDFERFYSFDFDVEDLLEKMPRYSQRFRAKPRLSDWVEPEGRFYRSQCFSGDTKSVPDMSVWALGNLILNERAYGVFSEFIGMAGEFLPLTVNGCAFYMFNTLKVLNGDQVDCSNAVDIIDSGVHFGKAGFDILEDQLNKVEIFKLKEEKLVHSFVTQGFKSLCEDEGLTGLNFLQINCISSD